MNAQVVNIIADVTSNLFRGDTPHPNYKPTRMNILTSKPDAPKPLDPKSILAVGPPGGGKTTMALQFPKPLVIVIDVGLDGPEAYVRARNKKLEFGYVRATVTDDGKPLEPDLIYDRVLAALREARNAVDFQTVVVDNLTTLSDRLISKLVKAQGRDAMEGRDWGPYQASLINVFADLLRTTGKTGIMLAHEFSLERPTMGRDGKPVFGQNEVYARRPTIKGKLTDIVAGYFTDVWRCSCAPAPGGRLEFYIDSQRTNLDELKNSLGMPGRIVIPDGQLAWDKLAPYFKGYYETPGACVKSHNP